MPSVQLVLNRWYLCPFSGKGRGLLGSGLALADLSSVGRSLENGLLEAEGH